MADRARSVGATPEPHVPVYVISVAAELTGLHPQTLRQYDRMGLVSPGRTGGGGRRYSWHDIEQLREIARLTASGIGLEGVRRVLELEREVAALREHAAALADELDRTRAALTQALSAPERTAVRLPERLPAIRTTAAPGAVVVWRRGQLR
jgi:MerR family transcriptional regulator/heat shock protein HspR